MTATCGPDEVAVSGGYAGNNAHIVILADDPSVAPGGVPTGWHVKAHNNDPFDYPITVYVVCAS